MCLPTGPRAYIFQAFEDDLSCYKINVETNGDGFVLTFEYQPEDPTPNLAVHLKDIEIPSGFYLCYYDGHSGAWLMLHHKSKEEANATYKRLYMRYFRCQVYMCILKV